MKRPVLKALGLAMALPLVGCSGVTYYKFAESAPSVLSGEDCPGSTVQTLTIAGVDGDGTVAFYNEPNNQVYMDTGQSIGNVKGPAGLTGSLTSGVYNFTGSWTENIQGNPEVQTTENITVQLTQSGPGLTGTIQYEFICKGGGSGCSQTALGVGSSDGKDFDCKATANVLATTVSGPTEYSPTSTTYTPVSQ